MADLTPYVANFRIEGLPQGSAVPKQIVRLDRKTAQELLAVGAVSPVKTEEVTANMRRGQFVRVATGALLPDDFPHKSLLIPNGFSTLADLTAASDEDLLAVNGIGPATLREIRAAQTALTNSGE